MRRRSYLAAVLFAVFVMMTAIAFTAQAARPGIGERIARQQHRINHGIASRALTNREAGILQYNLDRVKIMASNMRARSGGVLMPRQKKRLSRMLDKNSAMISNKMHNPIRRF